jgi:hypothetical protein
MLMEERRMQADYSTQLSLWERGRSRRAKITSWIDSSVAPDLLNTARYQMLQDDKTGPRELFQHLKLMIAPS